MDKVFLGGSRRFTQLNETICDHAWQLMRAECRVLIGDADGADLALQRYFQEHQYPELRVYCVAGKLRHNSGNWPVEHVAVTRNSEDFKTYAQRDLQLCRDADRGWMLWDGRSKGTLNNILNLLEHQKPVQVYFAPADDFLPIAAFAQLRELLEHCRAEDLEKFRQKINLERRLNGGQGELNPI